MHILRLAYFKIFSSAISLGLMALLFFSACTPAHKEEVDRLNSLSYAFHYRNLDSTKVLAQRALQLAGDYDDGYAEACNNLAFVSIARLDYEQARKWLQLVEQSSDNQIELLVADVQNMRICQREGHNKDFYSYREKAMARLRRINEEGNDLPVHESKRVLYAQSEFSIVAATYFYYVGLETPMMEALNEIDADALEQDTAQYLNYLYNFGSGGAITQGTAEQINQSEFDYLMQCYMLASANDAYPYWQANSLQAISEHLQKPAMRSFLIKNNQPAIKYINVEQMPDTLLAGNLAQRALNLFISYGDVYQVAGGYRTLAECYFAIKDYRSAGNCLLHALNDNTAISKAPQLVASIREQLCLVYSALDDKPKSDYNRNIYLDLQEQTRQDRQLEARAAMLDSNAIQLNMMIAAVLFGIVLVILVLFFLDRKRRKSDAKVSAEQLLQPLREWEIRNMQTVNELQDKKEELEETLMMEKLHVNDNKKRNLEQRAKVSLVNSITPFIDRMINEVNRLAADHAKGAMAEETAEVKAARYQYISELTDKINQYNNVLTQWIQMRQGALSLHIESFALQPLFDMVKKGKMSFQMKGIELEVADTDVWIKADRTLTLFMINTIADNARKFTPQGGKVSIGASASDKYVDISITDTGRGMDEEQLAHVFDRTYTGGHGFGLLNCKGIIEKNKKVSSLFRDCDIQCKSQVGKGSVFTFRLPRGIQRVIAGILILLSSVSGFAKGGHKLHSANENLSSKYLVKADRYADSAYFSNIKGEYYKTLQFADSSRHYLNLQYLSLHPHGKALMVRNPKDMIAAELRWYHDSLATNYNVILDLRNETAVAALALHDWELYRSNNKVYTQLYHECGADNTLDDYVRTMQVSENSKMVAIILLVLLLLQLPFAYYFVYYRHVLSYRFAVHRVNDINQVLLSDESDKSKKEQIQALWLRHGGDASVIGQLDQVVRQITEALDKSMQLSQNEAVQIELLEDEVHRAEYENAQLHISNSVLDNCLSTLKHETMYYPSRIRQLIDTSPGDIESLRELVDYYKSLYAMLSGQAMQQVEGHVRFDVDMLSYLFEILKKETGQKKLSVKVKPKGKSYVDYVVDISALGYDEETCKLLFTPLTPRINLLLCRQIVREIGEVTNMRGCGVQAEKLEDGRNVALVTLPKSTVSKIRGVLIEN